MAALHIVAPRTFTISIRTFPFQPSLNITSKMETDHPHTSSPPPAYTVDIPLLQQQNSLHFSCKTSLTRAHTPTHNTMDRIIPMPADFVPLHPNTRNWIKGLGVVGIVSSLGSFIITGMTQVNDKRYLPLFNITTGSAGSRQNTDRIYDIKSPMDYYLYMCARSYFSVRHEPRLFSICKALLAHLVR